MIKRFFTALILCTLLFFSACLGILFYVTEQPWVDFSVLEHYNPGKPSILLDDEGNEWGRFQYDKRDVIKLEKIPKHVVNAFLAAEDWGYFNHSGLSIKGIVRSLLVNVIRRKKAQGASTITQQLVRLLYFDTAKSFKRKIKEQLLAIVIERQFTKEQILETYLNHIYLGSGIYGVEAASQRFWGKPVNQITIDEAAVLASIVRCPQEYCPLYNPESSRKRRNLILKNMHSLRFITKEDYEKARSQEVNTLKRDSNSIALHARETIRIKLEEELGKELLYTGGLTIHTTINKKMQETAEKVFADHMAKLHKNISSQIEGAVMSIEGATGAIKVMIGGTSFNKSQFNRALHARRQIGSTFKPLIYAHAFSQGRLEHELDIDEPITIQLPQGEWSPRNSTNRFDGPMTLAHALSTSNNTITVKTFMSTGPEKVVALAQKCGLKVTEPYPALALGCIDASLSQAVCMMNVFAQQGNYVEPYLIHSIKDEWGTKIWKGEANKKTAVLSNTISSRIAKLLMVKIEKSKKKHPQTWFDCEAFGKTGTTNDARTSWFIGCTPKYTTGIYIGRDDYKALGDEIFGRQTAFPIWKEFNNRIKNDSKHFNFDTSLRPVTIHPISGTPLSADDPEGITIFV